MAYPKELVQEVPDYLDAGHSAREAEDRLDTSHESAARWRRQRSRERERPSASPAIGAHPRSITTTNKIPPTTKRAIDTVDSIGGLIHAIQVKNDMDPNALLEKLTNVFEGIMVANPKHILPPAKD